MALDYLFNLWLLYLICDGMVVSSKRISKDRTENSRHRTPFTDCGGTLLGFNGTFRWPNEGEHEYTSNTYCTWVFSAPPGYFLHIHFIKFNTETYYDQLKIRENEEVKMTFSGHNLPGGFDSTMNDVRITFESDWVINEEGFVVEWHIILPTVTTCPPPVVCPAADSPEECPPPEVCKVEECTQPEPVCNPACLNGDCTATDTCTCNEGWTGDACNEAVCDPACVNGDCTDPNICTCGDGWSGTTCNEAVCDSACLNGDCTDPNTCTCVDGWSGATCNEELQCPSVDGSIQCESSDSDHCSTNDPCTNSSWCCDGPCVKQCLNPETRKRCPPISPSIQCDSPFNDECTKDSDCGSDQWCCSAVCGMACVKPKPRKNCPYKVPNYYCQNGDDECTEHSQCGRKSCCQPSENCGKMCI